MSRTRWLLMMLAPVWISGMVLCAQARQDMRQMEVHGFRVPDYDAEGNMTSQLFGERAVMQGDSEVKITGLKIEFYQQGETVMTVTSPYCFFNQDTRNATSDAPVQAEMDRVRIRGRGFVLDSEQRVVTVLEDSHVTLYDVKEGNDGSAPVTNTTVITSKRMIIHYDDRTALFEEDVRVQDGRMDLHCDELKVHFGEDHEIQWIGASGGIRLLSEGREALAGRAEYDLRTDEVVLYDNPRIIDGRNMLEGDRIRFWRSEGRMVCEPSARMVVYTGAQVTTGLFGR